MTFFQTSIPSGCNVFSSVRFGANGFEARVCELRGGV